MALSLRRVVDAFLRVVTPPRRDYTLLTPEAEDGWPDHGETAVIYRALMTGRYARFDPDEARRLGYWPGQEHRPDFVRAFRERDGADAAPLERPWNFRWDRVAKRSAGPGFSRDNYHAARERSREVARRTLGEAQWRRFERDCYLDVRSQKYPGITYRLRVGRRVRRRHRRHPEGNPSELSALSVSRRRPARDHRVRHPAGGPGKPRLQGSSASAAWRRATTTPSSLNLGATSTATADPSSK